MNKEYSIWSTEFFNVELGNYVLNWKLLGTNETDINSKLTMKMLREHYGFDVRSYEVREIPKVFKRSNKDHAKLIIINTHNGNLIGKRYSNNQKFKIEVGR